jgi:hypothetical protein
VVDLATFGSGSQNMHYFFGDDLAIHASISISKFKWCILDLMKGVEKRGIFF